MQNYFNCFIAGIWSWILDFDFLLDQIFGFHKFKLTFIVYFMITSWLRVSVCKAKHWIFVFAQEVGVTASGDWRAKWLDQVPVGMRKGGDSFWKWTKCFLLEAVFSQDKSADRTPLCGSTFVSRRARKQRSHLGLLVGFWLLVTCYSAPLDGGSKTPSVMGFSGFPPLQPPDSLLKWCWGAGEVLT